MDIQGLTLLLLMAAASGVQISLFPNSKFLDPELTDEENIEAVTAGDDARTFNGGNIVKDSKKETSTLNEMQSKLSGHKKFVFSKFVHPVLSMTGLSNGGLYGAQYYGLASPTSPSWKVPYFNYPFYNYKLPWAQKLKPQKISQ